MAQVKVWNDNTFDYKDTFKGNDIFIPAKSCIEMEYFEAHEFRGAYKSIERDGDNQPLPRSFKMIRVEEPAKDEIALKPELNACAACKFKGTTPKALLEHILAEHADQAVVDEEAEKEVAKKKRVG